MTEKLYARFAIAKPTGKVSLTREFVEVSGTNIKDMTLPDNVVRVDFFADLTAEQPAKRVFLGVDQVYNKSDIDHHYGEFFTHQIEEAGGSHAVLLAGLGKLVPAQIGDEFVHTDGLHQMAIA